MIIPPISATGTLPPMSFQGGSARSDAYGGTASGSAGFDNSGFVVNYAPSIGVGGSLPAWVWAAALVAAVVWMRKR